MNDDAETKTKLTVRQAINQNCKDCTYDPLDTGTWLDQVTNCHITKCALWEHRPLNKASRTVIKEAKIAAMSDEERRIYEHKQEIARERMKQIRENQIMNQT